MRSIWLAHTPEGALDVKHTCFEHSVAHAHVRADCWEYRRWPDDAAPWCYEISVNKMLVGAGVPAHFCMYTGRAATLDEAKKEARRQIYTFDALLRLGWEP